MFLVAVQKLSLNVNKAVKYMHSLALWNVRSAVSCLNKATCVMVLTHK
jgi:hypothetical protein